jgi:hypothetical protein
MRFTTTAVTFALAFSQGIAAADDNKANAARAEMYCVRDHVASLDDGKMDPKRLAEIIVPICHSLHEASEQEIQPQEWNATPADRRHEEEFMHTWAAVLWSRNSLNHRK